MLGVEENALAGLGQEGDRLGDHLEVLLEPGPHDRLDLHRRRLPDEGYRRRKRLRKHGEALVLAGGDATPAGHAEGDDRRVLEGQVGEELEELALLGVGGGKAGLDHVDAQLVQPLDDAHLLLGGQRHAPAAHAVAESRVV